MQNRTQVEAATGQKFELVEVELDSIDISGARRPLDQDTVLALADSIAREGVLHPPTLTQPRRLLAGLHRYAACKLLGYRHLLCLIVPEDELRNELVEIDENLVRKALTVLERCELYKRLKILLAREQEQHRAGNNFLPGCSRIIAERLKLTTRTINLYIEVSNLIAPEIKELIAPTPIADKLSELRVLKRVPAEEQRQLVEMVFGGEARSIEHAWRKSHRRNQEELSKPELRVLEQVLEGLSGGAVWAGLSPGEVTPVVEKYSDARELIFQSLRWLFPYFEPVEIKGTKVNSATPAVQPAGQQQKETGDGRQLRLPPGKQIAGS
jgi:ParB-like chromosome segregation protein Spo0J